MDQEQSITTATEEPAALRTSEPASPISDPPSAPSPNELRRGMQKRVKKTYGGAALVMLIQLAISTVISLIMSIGYSTYLTALFMAEHPDLALEEIETMVNKAITPTFMLLTVVISYLVANLASFFIGKRLNKRRYRASIFGKIRLRPFDCVLAVFSVLGLQMVSVIIQSFIMSITNLSGVDESTTQMVSFSEDPLQNILLVLYMVVIAAITEELLCRGVVMQALSPASTTFALIASSMMFGIMHGNFNQMFNGFLLGMAIGYAAIKSRSIFLPIIMHMCANGHAMLLTFLEYKFGAVMVIFEGLYIFLMAFLGMGALAWLLVRNGRPNDATDGYPCTLNLALPEKPSTNIGLTWKALIKSPCFWIFVGIYFLTAVISLTPLG